MKIVAFVPAKGSSDRVKSKNLRILDGELLFKRKLRQLLECDLIDEVYLDTESDQIAALADDLDVKLLKRDPALATNATDGHEMFENECRHAPGADLYIQVLCTAPFVDAKTLRRAIEALIAAPDCDSLVGVASAKQYLWRDGEPLYGRGRVPNSVDLPVSQIEAMSLYIVRATSPSFPRKRYGVKPLLFELTPRELIDINYEADLQLAESVAAGDRQREAQSFRALRSNLTSTVFSDLTKDMGLNCTAAAAIKPMLGGRTLGRAKTLELGALSPESLGRRREGDESWKGIYDALGSYAFVRSGDVIVVSTEVPERAYFGELNAHLAVRAGAVGVLVDGFTRDLDGVAPLDLPVFARGNWCNDIKYEGTTKSMNRRIKFAGLEVNNNDVVFADRDGCVVVPAAKWDEVLEKAIDMTINESRIRINAALGRPVNELLDKYGFF